MLSDKCKLYFRHSSGCLPWNMRRSGRRILMPTSIQAGRWTLFVSSSSAKNRTDNGRGCTAGLCLFLVLLAAHVKVLNGWKSKKSREVAHLLLLQNLQWFPCTLRNRSYYISRTLAGLRISPNWITTTTTKTWFFFLTMRVRQRDSYCIYKL